jgi:hypothetical protein
MENPKFIHEEKGERWFLSHKENNYIELWKSGYKKKRRCAACGHWSKRRSRAYEHVAKKHGEKAKESVFIHQTRLTEKRVIKMLKKCGGTIPIEMHKRCIQNPNKGRTRWTFHTTHVFPVNGETKKYYMMNIAVKS